jgi:hypothetical protein
MSVPSVLVMKPVWRKPSDVSNSVSWAPGRGCHWPCSQRDNWAQPRTPARQVVSLQWYRNIRRQSKTGASEMSGV